MFQYQVPGITVILNGECSNIFYHNVTWLIWVSSWLIFCLAYGKYLGKKINI